MIKRTIGTFLASLLFVSHLAAQSLLLTGAGSADSLLPNQIIFQSSQTCAPSSGTCTVSGATFGAAQSNRYIIAVLHNSFGCTATATIGGVSATSLRQVTLSTGSAIFGANVPTGTTGNIITNCSSDTNQEYIAWYTIYGLNSLTVDGSCQASNGTSCSTAGTVAGGYLITGTTYNSSGSTTLSGTGTVQTYDANFVSSTFHAAGGYAPTTGGTLATQFSRAASSIQQAVAIH